MSYDLPIRATRPVAWLAILGGLLLLTEMLQSSVPNRKERGAFYDELLRLIAKEESRFDE
jgi:uncharacterized membrane protein